MLVAKIETILVGILFIGFAISGVTSGRARIHWDHVDRQKEPVGFWLAIGVQIAMGTAAVVYGVVR